MENSKEKSQSYMEKKKVLWKIADAGPIIRRYFVMNFFDGLLTSFGIVLGFLTTQLEVDKSVIVSTGLLTAISIGIFSCIAQVWNHINDYSSDKDSGTMTFAVWVGFDTAKKTLKMIVIIHILGYNAYCNFQKGIII